MLKSVEAIKASIPLNRTDTEQLWIQEFGNQLFVKIENNNGTTGWGEILTAAGNSRDPYIAVLNVLTSFLAF